MRARLSAILVIATLALTMSGPAKAQNDDVPYWASIRASVVNMRVGPAESYRIAWVYKRVGLPVKVIRRQEGWRLIEDPDGTTGWVLGRFLTPDRGAIVIGKGLADIRSESSPSAKLRWRAEPGVSGKLGDCERGWCEFDVGGQAGWVRENRLWGPGEP